MPDVADSSLPPLTPPPSPRWRSACASAMAMALAACGGGGSSSSPGETAAPVPPPVSAPSPLPMPTPAPAPGASAPTPGAPAPTPGTPPPPPPAPPPPPPPAAAVSGIAAAGLALTNGTVRVLDATGKALVFANTAVAPTTGAYGPIPLGNVIPYRIEACGTVGDKPVCLWAATNLGGTVNLTPLTTAITVLASGVAPGTLMKEGQAAKGLTDADIAAAHTLVRSALAPALSYAGLASDFDLLAGALTPNSHTGQDLLLDAIALGLGVDTKPYVTLGSRFGAGVVYLEPGATPQGSISVDAAAASMDLAGLNTLFSGMAAGMATEAGCPTGLPPLFDTNVRVSTDTQVASGPDLAAQVLCFRLAGVLPGAFGETDKLFGGKLLPTNVDRCVFDAALGDPVCRVSFVYQASIQDPTDATNKTPWLLQRPLGIEQAAVKRSDGWKFLGNRLAVQASAKARLVLARRVDSPTTPDVYSRFLDIAIPAVGNLRCARASQKDTNGADVPLALFKPHGSGRYLSLWSLSTSIAAPSLNAASGATRGADIITLPVPAGATGDTTARNFARAGRALKIELFSDNACTTPLGGADGDAISITVAGQLPIATAAMSSQPWPTLAPTSATALADLKGAVATKVNYGPTWTFAHADVAMSRAQLCMVDSACSVKLVDLELPGTAKAARLSATIGILPLAVGDYKLLRLMGRASDGLVLQLDTASCKGQVSGVPC